LKDSVWTLLLCILVAGSSASAIGGVRGTTTMNHTSITITGDSGFTSANGVVAGTGVPADPYLIEGWVINSTVSQIGINVSNTRAYFVIQNVRVVNYRFQDHGVGIQFYNVTHGTVETSTIDDNRVGVSLYASSNVTFSGNEIANNTVDGIYVAFASANLTFTGKVRFRRAQFRAHANNGTAVGIFHSHT
jgi:parallel beta-helix repeat protein